MMIKVAEEVMQAMNATLQGPVENSSDKVQTALMHLNRAAELFDTTGNEACAEAITECVIKLAQRITNKKV